MAKVIPVTDAEIAEAFTGKNFGNIQQRDFLERSVLKVATGFGCGHTIMVMMRALGLIGADLSKPRVTARGKLFMRGSKAIRDFLKRAG